MNLKIGEQDWRFVEGTWSQDGDGVMRAPENAGDANLAICTASAWRDFQAELEFCWGSAWTNAGFVFRATDARCYYMVHFPVVGQHRRAEHFWACVSKVDDRGWVQVLEMEMIHGVTSQSGVWHRVKVAAAGPEIRVWIDGRPMSTVTDHTYDRPGYVGLSTFCGTHGNGKSSFRNLRIEGMPATVEPFDESATPQRNWFRVTDVGGHGTTNIVRTGNRDLLTTTGSSMTTDKPVFCQLRSCDNGRTWTAAPTDLPGLMRLAPDGTLEVFVLASDPPFTLTRAVSADHGHTWSAPQTLGAAAFPEEFPWRHMYACRLLETRNGTLCLFAYACMESSYKVINGRFFKDVPVPDAANYCLRSTDGGLTWSDPEDLDGGDRDDENWMVAKEGSEISAAQTRDGKILALMRPFLSPVMWESWSEDDGATWTDLMRGPFPMYACNNSMITTTSGALLIGGRFPGLGLQVSFDDGMTWQGHMIDNAIWANGAMLEIEPDTVLYVYGASDNPRELRAQIIRINGESIEPTRPE